MRRVVVITGATAGVGRATARAFAARGDAVALLARGEDRLQATRSELEAMGARVIACSVDVADADAVEAAAQRTERELGPIDLACASRRCICPGSTRRSSAGCAPRCAATPSPSRRSTSPSSRPTPLLWAADHPHREFFVAAPTVKTILGNKLAPRIADRYLARTSVSAQQTDIEIPPDRPEYLYAPLPGDRGARGRFSDQARSSSIAWTITKRRARLAGGAALAGAVAAAGLAVRRS